jgi:hypothetical protein
MANWKITQVRQRTTIDFVNFAIIRKQSYSFVLGNASHGDATCAREQQLDNGYPAARNTPAKGS